MAGLDECAAVLKRKLESEERHLIESLEHWKLELGKLNVRKKRVQDEIKELEGIVKYVNLSRKVRNITDDELTGRKKDMIDCTAELMHAQNEVDAYEQKLRIKQGRDPDWGLNNIVGQYKDNTMCDKCLRCFKCSKRPNLSIKIKPLTTPKLSLQQYTSLKVKLKKNGLDVMFLKMNGNLLEQKEIELCY